MLRPLKGEYQAQVNERGARDDTRILIQQDLTFQMQKIVLNQSFNEVSIFDFINILC